MRGGSTFLLLVGALVLGAVVVAEVRFGAVDALALAFGGAEPPPAAAATKAHPRGNQGAVRPLPPLEALTATRERPLFFENRVYPEVESEASAGAGTATSAPEASGAPTPLGPVKLSAIVIVDDERVALIREGEATESQYVRRGGKVNGWEVTEIRVDSVVLRNGARTEELKLWTFEPVPLPTPPRGANATGAAGDRDARLRAEQRRLSALSNAVRKGTVPASVLERARAAAASGGAPTAPRPQGERDCGLSRC